jgi:predicted Zn-dependent peptidase
LNNAIYQISRLNNGLTIATAEMPHMASVSLGLWVGVGGRYEPAPLNGVSHFIEHLLFKGTRKRSAQQIAKEIDAVGGVLNAFTGKEFSSFYAKVLDEHLPLAIDLLFDLFLNSLFSRDELEKERQVIAQEINMVEDTPDEYIHDLFSESFWPRHPLGLPILGRLETISRMKRTELVDFLHHRYTAIAPILVAAGNLKHDALLNLVADKVARIKPRKGRKQGRPPQAHRNVTVKNKPLEQVHVLLGTQAPSATHPQRYALSILNTVFGGGMSSRLFQEIREKRGLSYSVYSFLSSFVDSGMLGVYAGTGQDTVARVLRIVLKEMKKLENAPLSRKELSAAKEQLKGNLLLSLESTDSRMGRLAKSEIYFGRFIGTEEIIQGIDRVTADEVGELANLVFKPDSLSLTVLGPVTEKSIPEGLWPR